MTNTATLYPTSVNLFRAAWTGFPDAQALLADTAGTDALDPGADDLRYVACPDEEETDKDAADEEDDDEDDEDDDDDEDDEDDEDEDDDEDDEEEAKDEE